MREFGPKKQGVSRGLRPNLLILNKGAITSLSSFKPFGSNRAIVLWSADGKRGQWKGAASKKVKNRQKCQDKFLFCFSLTAVIVL